MITQHAAIMVAICLLEKRFMHAVRVPISQRIRILRVALTQVAHGFVQHFRNQNLHTGIKTVANIDKQVLQKKCLLTID